MPASSYADGQTRRSLKRQTARRRMFIRRDVPLSCNGITSHKRFPRSPIFESFQSSRKKLAHAQIVDNTLSAPGRVNSTHAHIANDWLSTLGLLSTRHMVCYLYSFKKRPENSRIWCNFILWLILLSDSGQYIVWKINAVFIGIAKSDLCDINHFDYGKEMTVRCAVCR